MKFLFALFAAITFSGCAWFHAPATPDPEPGAAESSYTHIDVAGEIATPAEHAACGAIGGSIRREGMLGWEHCVQTYPDAGKACSGEADCLGTCRYEGEVAEPGTHVPGTCQVVDVPFSCYATVEDGRLQHALCVD